MRSVGRIGGALAILLALAGCTIVTHTAVAVATPLPTCDKTLIELNHLSTSLASESHIPLTTPGPMRFCRYRWNNNENKLALMADDSELIAPIALLQALNKLKTMNEVYGPNVVFPCPSSQGNADLVVLQPGKDLKLTVVEVQRDGCGRVIVSHPGMTSYIAYLSTPQLLVQLDAIIRTSGIRVNNLPTIHVTPSVNLHDGQRVLVQITGAVPGERFRISECATAADANAGGCGDQPALQPFIDTDQSGSGSITFYVKARAATKPVNTAVTRQCTVQCVLMTTGFDIYERATLVYAPLKFSK